MRCDLFASFVFSNMPSAKKQKEAVVLQFGPKTTDEFVFGIAHIYASFNDTFVHVTDLSGKETISRITGNLQSRFVLKCRDCWAAFVFVIWTIHYGLV